MIFWNIYILKTGLVLVGLSFCLPIFGQGSVSSKDIIQKQNLITIVTNKYRGATLAIKSLKEDKSGAIHEVEGSGFVVGKSGHILTSCHVVDQIIRNDAGVAIGQAEKVTRSGSVGSREGSLEKVNWLGCASPPFDIALLKFANTFPKREDIPVNDVRPHPGDEIAAIGYPLDIEIFPRGGFIGIETGNDTYTVAMPMNRGDSGAPVFNKELVLVGIAEGGYPGAGIGIVRPLRHAAGLLSQAGIYLTTVNTSIESKPAPSAPLGTKVEQAYASAALNAFVKGNSVLPNSFVTVKVTYPFVRVFDTGTGEGPTSVGRKSEKFNLSDIQAKPGYKITDAKFIVIDKQNADVLNVSVPANGKLARTAIEKYPNFGAQPSFVRGFVETTQIPLLDNKLPTSSKEKRNEE